MVSFVLLDLKMSCIWQYRVLGLYGLSLQESTTGLKGAVPDLGCSRSLEALCF